MIEQPWAKSLVLKSCSGTGSLLGFARRFASLLHRIKSRTACHREYGPGGAYEFWSLGEPKVEIAKLCTELEAVLNLRRRRFRRQDGLSALILGCGLGLDAEA